MIPINELRVGNIVKFISSKPETYNDNITLQIISIDEYSCDGVYGKNKTVTYRSKENLYGIPLTPELLQALGFNIDPDYEDDTYVKGYHVNLNDHFFISQTKDGWYCKCIAPNLEIKYVHQLQNLYFALTCQELNLPD